MSRMQWWVILEDKQGRCPWVLGGCDSIGMGTLLFIGQVAQQGSPQGRLCWREVIYLLLSVAHLSLVSLVVTGITGGHWCCWSHWCY